MSAKAAQVLRTNVKKRMFDNNIDSNVPSLFTCRLVIDAMAEYLEVDAEYLAAKILSTPKPRRPDVRQMELPHLEQP